MNTTHTLIHAGIAVDNPHQYNVTIGTDIGEFSGTVVCREEDYPHEAKYFGFELAELKAEIKYARAKRAYYDAELSALTRFWRMMADTRTYKMTDFWVKKMREEVDKVTIQRDYWANNIATLKCHYKDKIVLRDLANKKLTQTKKRMVTE